MALVVALLVLLALTILGSALMLSVNTETRIAGQQLRDAQALSAAEGGIQEAMLRLRTGDVPDNMNKRMVTLIYEAPAGSIPVSGADTTSLPTVQPAGRYLGYAGGTKKLAQGSTTDLSALTIRYKTRIIPGTPPDTQIVRWDDTAIPRMNTTTGSPVFQIVSTGTKGTASRSLVAEVTRSRFNILDRGAVVAQVGIQFKGNINVCGHDHKYSTPINASPVGAGALFCNSNANRYPDAATHTSCMPGAWSEESISQNGSPTLLGDPGGWLDSQTGFYSGPWDALSMTQTDFWTWVGTSQAPPAVPNGIYYLDNNGTKQDASGDW